MFTRFTMIVMVILTVITGQVLAADLFDQIKQRAQRALKDTAKPPPASPPTTPSGPTEPEVVNAPADIPTKGVVDPACPNKMPYTEFKPAARDIMVFSPDEAVIVLDGREGRFSITNERLLGPKYHESAGISNGGGTAPQGQHRPYKEDCLLISRSGGHTRGTEPASKTKVVIVEGLYKPGDPQYEKLFRENRFDRFLPEPFDNILKARKGDLIVIPHYAGGVHQVVEYVAGEPATISLARWKGDRSPDKLTISEARRITSQPVWRVIPAGSPEYQDALWKFENHKQFNHGTIEPGLR